MRVPKWLKKALGERQHWLNGYEKYGLRRGFAENMRWWADLIGPEDAFTKHSGLRFANRVPIGQVLYVDRWDGATVEPLEGRDVGVDLWYRIRDYKARGWEER